MKCEFIDVGGQRVIVCGRGRPSTPSRPMGAEAPFGESCACRAPASLLCDWKLDGGKTCDAPICAAHAKEVAPEKHLCPEHQVAYAAWLERQRTKVGA
jgi:hypothetical protein